jgi:hypothetical protein
MAGRQNPLADLAAGDIRVKIMGELTKRRGGMHITAGGSL